MSKSEETKKRNPPLTDGDRANILAMAIGFCEDLGDDIEIMSDSKIDETPGWFWVHARVWVKGPTS
jgi:hypothetical protein